MLAFIAGPLKALLYECGVERLARGAVCYHKGRMWIK
jgi:hypothetical protein